MRKNQKIKKKSKIKKKFQIGIEKFILGGSLARFGAILDVWASLGLPARQNKIG